MTENTKVLAAVLQMNSTEDVAANVASAFAMVTGRAHWEVFMSARAVEDQVFVVAAKQVGRNGEGLDCYGRSMIVDPWGRVLAQVGDGEGIAVAELDLLNLEQV